jgi:hypothetical protein
VACWGANDHGQATPPSGSFLSVAATCDVGYTTCAIGRDYRVVCWGVDLRPAQ